MAQLSIRDHSRDSAGMTYVYPVVSRRAGGVSVGINLNTNNACNWRCIYCQVPDLQRGGPPPIDLDLLEHELREILARLFAGDYLERHVAPEARRVVDIAFSGNGEPTSAAEFSLAVGLAGRVLDDLALLQPPRLRLITNGSLIDRQEVLSGIAEIGRRCGEVWFKVDAATTAQMRRINGVTYESGTVLRRLRACGELCATWVQTCWFSTDGNLPTDEDIDAYLELLVAARDRLAGVHLYGLARPSLQAEAPRLASVAQEWFEKKAEEVRSRTGLTVRLSP